MNETVKNYYLIVGMGRSGLSMARFLHSKGFNVIATDINPEAKAAAKS